MQQFISYPIRQTFRITDQALAKQVHSSLPDIDDMTFLNAVERGFWSSNFELSPRCPSGNCTWPVFQSLGLRSRCKDITAQATLDGCRNVTVRPDINYTTYASCNVTLPYGDVSQEPIHIETTGRGRVIRLPTNIV
ncbi:hypothetical protein BJY01DRAFT_250647 [Aspergillus pseudoustus]|uniref:Uncharacterized protein n=1 Tax=Aspergillus pseudoustus TaxID=1810923 RepID=A0ABR4JGE6_9EURO